MLENFRTKLLEDVTRKKLLTNDLESSRLLTPVVKLPSKAYPKGYFEKVSGIDGLSAQFSIKDFDEKVFIGRSGFKHDIFLMRKAFPHCMYGLMIVKEGTEKEVAIEDFNSQDRSSFYKIAEEWAHFCESREIYPIISWTYDPETRDRKSGQSQMWYHMHLNSNTEEEKQKILKDRKPLKEISTQETKRSFIDEFSILSSLILKDYFTSNHIIKSGKIVGPFESQNLPNFGVLIDNDWRVLLDKNFDKDIVEIHKVIIQLYNLIKNTFFNKNSGIFERPIKNELKVAQKDFSWMSQSTVDCLNLYLENLDADLFKTHIDFFKNNPKSKLTSHLYPLAGANYCTSITKIEHNKLLVSIRPQMFSETGAAGLYQAFGTAVKTARGSEVYSEIELNKKIKFENDFIKYLNSNLKNIQND